MTRKTPSRTVVPFGRGSWKEKSFKPYNFDALGVAPASGHLHPLLKVRAEFRKIFIEMGFTEMPTNNFIESSFWNFDVLFQPQQHPARDAHDTFFISGSMSLRFFVMEWVVGDRLNEHDEKSAVVSKAMPLFSRGFKWHRCLSLW